MQEEVVHKLIEAINQHHLEGILNCLSNDHILRDSRGDTVKGAETLHSAWGAYLHIFPDYHIDVEEKASNENTILLTGWASGSVKIDNKKVNWRIPAAWKVRVENGKVSEWQVFADNSVVQTLLSEAHASEFERD